MISTFLLTLLAAGHGTAGVPEILAIRVGRAETIAQGTIEHAVVLVENGKITAIGQDLPIERGIPILDRPDWVLMPGLVDCHSRVGLDGRGGAGSEPHRKASDELHPREEAYEDLLELGVTTLGLFASGTGIPGQAVAIKPKGDTAEEMIVADSVYLKINLRTNSKSQKMLRDAFEKADEYEEKVAKAREKWEKAQEKAKKKKKSKKKDDKKKDDKKKDDEKEDDEKKEADKEKSGPFVPPEPDPKVAPFLALRSGELSALMSIVKSSDYLHLLDALGDEEIQWSLHCPLRDEIDLYEIKERLGEDEVRIVLEPEITLQQFTRRERNLPAELSAAGAKLALIPSSFSSSGYRGWLGAVGHLVRAGLDRDVALRAITLEPAELLGLGERLGSIENGKDANLILFDGDPLEPSSRIRIVMLEGEIVYEYEPVYQGGDQ